MARLVCSVPGCKEVKSDVQMFHVPRILDLSLRWKKIIGNLDNMSRWKIGQVCEMHFRQEDYYLVRKGAKKGHRKLIKGVVPTRNLPEFAVLAEIHNYNIPIYIPHQPGNPVYGSAFKNSLLDDPAFQRDPKFENLFPEEGEERKKTAIDQELIDLLRQPEKKPKKKRKRMTKEELKAEKKRLRMLKRMPSQAELLDKEAISRLRARILSLKEGKMKLQKENANLNQKIKLLKRKQKNLTEKDKEELVHKLLEKHYSKAQIKCYLRGNWQQSKMWEERDFKLALMIHTISKRCFHYLRNHQVLPMPSYTSLKKHTFDDGRDIRAATEAILTNQNTGKCGCLEEPCQHTEAEERSVFLPVEEQQVAVMNILESADGAEQEIQLVHEVIEGQQEIHVQPHLVGDQVQYFVV